MPKKLKPQNLISNSEILDISSYAPDKIRNFSIIAHIDHGKSTLADRLLELTNTISSNSSNKQVLDKLKVERERGITVKAQTASMFFRSDGLDEEDGMETDYLLNLIDTPGHVDFSYEVRRSLSACQGVLLLVDAAQGVQAQTVATYHMALSEGLTVIPVINKIDLPAADPQHVASQITALFSGNTANLSTHPSNTSASSNISPLLISAKTGIGISQILPSIISNIPAPTGSSQKHLKMLLFDSWYDLYVGVVCLVFVENGVLRKGDKITSHYTSNSYETLSLGILHPNETQTSCLSAGQVGYITLGMKSTRDALIGDTFFHEKEFLKRREGWKKPSANEDVAPEKDDPYPPLPFPNFRPSIPLVFSGCFPPDAANYDRLKDAIERLTLNDRSVSIDKETSAALGQGFRLGFLGTLHMDVFRQRLEDEFGIGMVNTLPSVPVKITFTPKKMRTNNGMEETIILRNPVEFPDPEMLSNVTSIQEPMVSATMIFPEEYLGSMMELCGKHRSKDHEHSFLTESSRVLLKCKFPMSEILTDFYDQLKSRSSVYASFDYEECGFEESDLVKVNVLLNGKVVDALTSVVHRSKADRVGKEWVGKLKDTLSRQLYEITIQATVNSKVITRETIKALKKDVLAKCYGGDITRKMKLLQKVKEGKKRMKMIGNVEIGQDEFMELLNGKNKK
ncbi:hypothetical protein HK098_004241 [Nowakowskiella sp. JEL0407]|nr:hypothetical protein HK098_004241 [Nowakowskiella sp. JEL0407]